MAEKVVVQLVLDTSKYTTGARKAASATAKVDTAVKKTAKSTSSLQKSALKAGAAFGVAFGARAVIKGIANAVRRAEALASQYAITEQIIKQTGGSANATGAEIAELSRQTSLLTGVDKLLVTEGNNILLSFKQIANQAGAGNDIFDRTSRVMLDVATVMKTDIPSAAKQLGKALNDPISGLGGLSRAGIQFNDQQKEQIRLMVESGDLVGAQVTILRELESQVGGTAEASADSTAKIANAFREGQEIIGIEFLRLVDLVVGNEDAIVGVFEAVASELREVVDLVVRVADVTKAIANLGDEFDETGEKAERFSLVPSQIRAPFERMADFLGQSVPAQINQLIDTLFDADEALVVITDDMIAADLAAGAFDGGLDTLGTSLDIVAAGIAGVDAVSGSAIDTTSRYEAATRKSADAAEVAATAKRREIDAIREAVSAQNEAASPILRLFRSQERLIGSQERLNELKDDEEATDRDIAAATLDVLEAQGDLEAATLGASGAIDGGVTALIEFGVQAGIDRDIIIELATQLGLLPTQVDIDLNLNTRMHGGVDTPGGVRRALEAAQSKAHGGPVTAGAPFIVGEQGPELFIPNQSGVIAPNKALGGGVTVHVHQPETSDLASDLAAGLIAGQVTQLVESIR